METIEVLSGIAAIEVTRIHEENWSAFSSDFPVRIGFRDTKDRKVRKFRAGDRVDLVATLPDGYRPGDLAHIALPACMSWIQGGGKVGEVGRAGGG